MPKATFKDLGDVLRQHPEAAEVLHKHGVHVCSGCYITFFSDPEKAAAYHAVPDIKKFISDLEDFLAKKP